MGDLIELPKDKKLLEEIFEELIELDQDGLLRNFVVIYNFDYTPAEKENPENDGMVCKLGNNWFGRSSIECLGLATHMQHLIEEYIKNNG